MRYTSKKNTVIWGQMERPLVGDVPRTDFRFPIIVEHIIFHTKHKIMPKNNY
jgi:hypothetical protein